MGIPVMSFSAGFMPSPVLRFPGIQQPSGTIVVDVKLKIEFNNGGRVLGGAVKPKFHQ